MTVAIFNTVRAIPIYARVPLSGLFVSVVNLASTSFFGAISSLLLMF